LHFRCIDILAKVVIKIDALIELFYKTIIDY
jgi:hypothetical protein